MPDRYIGNTQLAVLITYYKKNKYTNNQILSSLTRDGVKTKSGEEWQLRNPISFITRNVDPYIKELEESVKLQEELMLLSVGEEHLSTRIVNKLMERGDGEWVISYK